MLGRLNLRPVLPTRVAVALVAALAAATCFFAADAQASPGAYRVLLTEPYPEGPHELGAQIAAFPDVASIDYADTGVATPTAAQLAPYDVVVSVGDSSYLDREAWGNSLADYLDAGGVLVQAGYDSWENAFPEGRFASGGYAPFIPGNNGNNNTSLGEFNASSPLMQGVTALTTSDNTEPELAPGASLVAKWTNGLNAIATKGRVVTTTAWIGDDYGPGIWSGDYGRLVVNAVRTLGRQRLSVVNANPAGGTVTSSVGGISCGANCSADLASGTSVGLSAIPVKGFAFLGFGGACTGSTCAVALTGGAKMVTANFAAFGFTRKIKHDLKNGTATVPVVVEAPGTIVLTGSKTKKLTKTVTAGVTNLKVSANAQARKTLVNSGNVTAGLTLTFTPTGGVPAALTKTIHLRQKIR